MTEESSQADNPLWYKDAVIYEIHVRSFYDSDGDGVGDFKGLTAKLDYLKDLGATAIWLLPFYPSPLKDDGYDIADYYDVNPQYGTLEDFKEFLQGAHRRGLRVITELVVNHTSDQHAWFQNARKSPPGSKLRDFYVWSNTHNKYTEARIIFKDFEPSNWAWDHVAKAYYWHRFYSHQPDINYDSLQAQKAVLDVLDFWLNLGVDGLRLDAVPYLYEREGTNCENLPETHAFLKKLRHHVDQRYKNRMLLGEANQWPEDAVAYFGLGDECHMTFNFPLMPRMFMAIQMEERFPIIDIMEHTPSIPENCQWATFLRNHDELTLEMVTDEERDYMYRIYAKNKQARINLGIRRRLAPLMGNDRRKIELMNVLLFTLPGTPVIYYGDELGMGDNYYLGDRNGVRTPMQWSADINAGFSKANPQSLYLPVIIDPEYHYQTVNFDNQRNESSLLWWMKKMIAIRKTFKSFGRGSIEFFLPENSKIVAFTRRYGDESLLVVGNVSGYPQEALLDLSSYTGYTPKEVLGGKSFTPIGKSAYTLTFAPYGYYIFNLVKEKPVATVTAVKAGPIALKEGTDWFEGLNKELFESEVLTTYVKKCRWFGGKAREIDRLSIRDAIPFQMEDSAARLVIFDVNYKQGSSETYLLPLAYIDAEGAKEIVEKFPVAIVSNVNMKSTSGYLYDVLYSNDFRAKLLAMILNRKTVAGTRGKLTSASTKNLKKLVKEMPEMASHVLRGEQSNTCIMYGDKIILKVVRRLEEGMNPELEIGEQLTKLAFPNIPPYLGHMEYGETHHPQMVVIMLQEFVRNEGDAWKFCLGEIKRYYDRIISQKNQLGELALSSSILDLADSGLPEQLTEIVGPPFLEIVGLLGTRTGEFHLVLASDSQNPDFAPESFSQHYQYSLSLSMLSYAEKVLELAEKTLTAKRPSLWKEWEEIVKEQEKAADRFKVVRLRKKGIEDVVMSKSDIENQFKALRKNKIVALKTRTHGDYHLGQVLYTGKDFVIIDYEGEPARPLSERRLKKSPLRDVAGMIRSFHYVPYAGLIEYYSLAHDDVSLLEKYAELWYKCCAVTFLKSYFNRVADSGIIPKDREALAILLDALLIEKAIYELGYELNNRPDWVQIPVRGIKDLLGKS